MIGDILSFFEVGILIVTSFFQDEGAIIQGSTAGLRVSGLEGSELIP